MSRSRSLAALSFAAVLLTCNLASGTSSPKAVPVKGVRAVGAVFESVPGAEPVGLVHACTGSVVASADGNLVLTAAHCLRNPSEVLAFAPMYAGGKAPYGYWPVTAVYEAPGWLASGDTTEDFAFLRVRPPALHSYGSLSSTVGSMQLAFNSGYRHQARIVGYPIGLAGDPIACTTSTYEYLGYSAFNCDGYVDGTSGAPFIVRSHGHLVITGDIGGLHQGGCTSATSYSSYFGRALEELYLRALAELPGDVPRQPGGDGC